MSFVALLTVLHEPFSLHTWVPALALTDIAPSDLIRTHRLNKAKTLLESGAANVAEAAWEVGFKDPSYFSKLYQEEFGVAPSATRK